MTDKEFINELKKHISFTTLAKQTGKTRTFFLDRISGRVVKAKRKDGTVKTIVLKLKDGDRELMRVSCYEIGCKLIQLAEKYKR